MLHIAQLMLGIVCLRLSLTKDPISDRSGQLYLNRGFMKTAFLILGVVALLSSIAGFLFDWFWKL